MPGRVRHFGTGQHFPRAASSPDRHTRRRNMLHVPDRMPVRPCCRCGSNVESFASPAPTHPGRILGRKRARLHPANLAPPPALGDSLSANRRLLADEPPPAPRAAGTSVCALEKTDTNLSRLCLWPDALWIYTLQGGDRGGRNQGLPQGQGACCHLLRRRLVWLLQAVPRPPRPGEKQSAERQVQSVCGGGGSGEGRVCEIGCGRAPISALSHRTRSS